MSEKTSRKNFLFATGTTVAGWLAFCGFRRVDAGTPGGLTPDSRAARQPVAAQPEPRAVPRRLV